MRAFRSRLFWLELGLVVLALLGTLATPPYDDAFFFKRIAVNFLEHGSLAWNIEDGPVHGSTSQLFQWLAVPVTALFRDHYFVAMRVLSAACALTSFVCVWQLTRGKDAGLSAAVACAAPSLLYAIPSGMETPLVVALLAFGLTLVYGPLATKLHWSAAPAFCVLVYLARPDAFPLLAIPVFVERWTHVRKAPIREALLMAALLGLCLFGFRLFYGTALPLAFYVKQAAFNPCGESFMTATAEAQRIRFSVFLLTSAPLFAAASLLRDRINLALLGSVVCFEVYHLAFTLDIMGMHGRYYLPALPLLAVAAGRGLKARPRPRTRVVLGFLLAGLAAAVAAAGWFPPAVLGSEGVPFVLYAIAALAASAVVYESGTSRRRGSVASTFTLAAAALFFAGHSSWPDRLPSDESYLASTIHRTTVFRGLDTLRNCFGESLRVYHSEIGVTGLRLQQGTVRDLAGLMSRDWLFRSEEFERACAKERPDAIFLPHRNCRVLHEQILRSRCLQGYRQVITESNSPLFVRAELFQRYRQCER